ncbi:hypothetical protein SLS56_004493 [Neofusicoccum ribis]|uniref:Thioesterase family protein n=1 Tax=Neofusicoccum ribis TaxID=45134 RepID=A0ABR3SW45_9PEZI
MPPYDSLRAAIVSQATAMGCDTATMTEHGVTWADDQDPFGHIKFHAFPHFSAVTNVRLFESFEQQLGDKCDDLLKARGIGVIGKNLNVEFKRPVSYPDAILVALRITEVKPDRYCVTTSMWSMRDQALVAEISGCVVFFDYRTAKVANLIQAGGVYRDLYNALSAKAERSNALFQKWKQDDLEKKKRNAKL